MADKTKKVPENVPGAYYVDEECDDCSLCNDIAEANFGRSDEGWSFVSKQPENDGEKALCEEAMESCPSECIGNDG